MKSKLILPFLLLISIVSFSQPALYWDRINDSSSYTRLNRFGSMITDRGGNIYLLCQEQGNNPSGCYESFITKYDQLGNFQWTVQDTTAIYNSFITDNSGNLYLCGQSNDTGVNIKAITSKYTTSGGRVWVKQYNNNTLNNSLLLLNSSLYTIGTTSTNTGSELLILEYSLNGTLQMTKSDSLGNAYTTGSLIVTDGNALYISGQTGTSAYVTYLAKYDQNANQIWLNKDSFLSQLPSAITISSDTYVYFTLGASGSFANTLLNKLDSSGHFLWRFQVPNDITSPPGIGRAVLDSKNNVIIGGGAGNSNCPIDPSPGAYLARLRPNGDTVFQYLNTYCDSRVWGYTLQDDDHIIAYGTIRDSVMELAAFDSLGHILWDIPLTFLNVGLWGGNVAVDSGNNIILGLASEYNNPQYDTTPLYRKIFIEARKYGNKLISGIEEINNNADLKVFPNPAKDQIHIVYSSGSIISTELMNIDGKKVNTQNILVSTTGEQNINVNNLAKGIYILRITTDKSKQATFKVIIE